MSDQEQAIHERLRRLTDILSGIAEYAAEVSRERCPYKSKPGLCTAQFSCRNQKRDGDGGAIVCGDDGKLDYRDAWEARPDAYEKTREKLRRIREDSERARRAKRESAGPA